MSDEKMDTDFDQDENDIDFIPEEMIESDDEQSDDEEQFYYDDEDLNSSEENNQDEADEAEEADQQDDELFDLRENEGKFAFLKKII